MVAGRWHPCRGMGRRRKATKKIAKKSRNVVAVLFKCPFCNTEDSVEVRDTRSPRLLSTATHTMTRARSCATTARSRRWIGPRQQGVSSAAYAERATRRRSIVSPRAPRFGQGDERSRGLCVSSGAQIYPSPSTCSASGSTRVSSKTKSSAGGRKVQHKVESAAGLHRRHASSGAHCSPGARVSGSMWPWLFAWWGFARPPLPRSGPVSLARPSVSPPSRRGAVNQRGRAWHLRRRLQRATFPFEARWRSGAARVPAIGGAGTCHERPSEHPRPARSAVVFFAERRCSG